MQTTSSLSAPCPPCASPRTHRGSLWHSPCSSTSTFTCVCPWLCTVCAPSESCRRGPPNQAGRPCGGFLLPVTPALSSRSRRLTLGSRDACCTCAESASPPERTHDSGAAGAKLAPPGLRRLGCVESSALSHNAPEDVGLRLSLSFKLPPLAHSPMRSQRGNRGPAPSAQAPSAGSPRAWPVVRFLRLRPAAAAACSVRDTHVCPCLARFSRRRTALEVGALPEGRAPRAEFAGVKWREQHAGRVLRPHAVTSPGRDGLTRQWWSEVGHGRTREREAATVGARAGAAHTTAAGQGRHRAREQR